MKGEKVKVFTLAKRYGFKSAEFVVHLRNIGFPVSSYQASIDNWDVPVIEERLVRGGLMDAGKATTMDEADAPEEKSDIVGWKVVVGAPAAPPVAVEEEEEEEAEEPEPAAEEAQDEAEPSEPAFEEPSVREAPAAAAPAESEEALETEPVPAPKAARPEAARPAVEEQQEEEEVEKPAETAEAATGAEDAEEEPDEAAAEEPKPAAAGKAAAAQPPKPTPKPRPRAGATKVGKIDLATLGKMRARQSQSRNVTFTDIRDRESNRRQMERTKQREKSKSRRAGTLGPKKVSTQERKTDVTLEAPVTVKSFSAGTGIGVSQILGKLMGLGMMANINASLDEDTLQILAEEFGIGIKVKQHEDVESSLMEEIEAARKSVDDSRLEPRPPVIAFLGHVDHGKTSLIDALRQTSVVEGEAGGITQHIGAYSITASDGRTITIIDTPGHKAFTAMRARGANTTDIVILVVAADDGVMPQTEEAINHARAAGVPIIVALNKIDRPNANPERVKTQLASLGLQSEDWGGQTAVIPVSAIQKTGLVELVERVLLESELLQLKAHLEGEATGTVLEATTSEGRGKVATVLVQDGTLHVGDALLAGPTYGTVRRMYDHQGTTLKSAGPSTPVEILGLNELPSAGDRFYVVSDASTAKEVAEKRNFQVREAERAEKSKVSMENLFEQIGAEGMSRVNLIVKADVQGTLEVLNKALNELSTEEVTVKLVHSAVGGITESDVLLAETAGAIVIGFGVVPDEKARVAAERSNIEIRRYNVIYELLEDVQKAMEGLLAPSREEEVRGHAEVRQVFRSSKFGNIAGCMVTDGEIKRSHRVRLTRDGRVVYEGQFDSLRRVKDDVREVRSGFECGIKIKNFDDIKEGDVIEAYEVVEQARFLEGAAES